MATHQITPGLLTLERVDEILRKGMKLELSEESKARIIKCREYLDNKMKTQKEPIYGVTTGFGSLCNISISKSIFDGMNKALDKVSDINERDIDIVCDAGLANIASYLKAIYGDKGPYDLTVTDDLGNSLLGMWKAVNPTDAPVKIWKTVE